MKEELVYLGFIISQGKMDLEKVKEIMEWLVPRSTFEV
jgi:hypothetical protein